MINYPEGVNNELSDSLSIIDNKITTEVCEFPIIPQSDRISTKSGNSNDNSEPSIAHTPRANDTNESDMDKCLKPEQDNNISQDNNETNTAPQAESGSNIERADGVFTRVETFGIESEEIQVISQDTTRVSNESHTLADHTFNGADSTEMNGINGTEGSEVLINRGDMQRNEYDSDASSSDSDYSNVSQNTTNNMQLMRKSPFSTRKGSDISENSLVSRPSASCQNTSSKARWSASGSEGWSDVNSASQSNEMGASLTSQVYQAQAQAQVEVKEAASDQPSPKTPNHTSLTGSNTTIQNKHTPMESPNWARLITKAKAPAITPMGTKAATDILQAQTARPEQDEDATSLVSYKKVEDLTIRTNSQEISQKTELTVVHTAVPPSSSRNLPQATHQVNGPKKSSSNGVKSVDDKKSVVTNLSTKSPTTGGRDKAMEKFNGFFTMVRSKFTRHTVLISMIFWFLSFACLYPAIFTGWLKNEIEYSKGDIKGSSVTVIGLSKIGRYDAAYLKDGALLTLSRNVTFDEILDNDSTLRFADPSICTRDTANSYCGKDSWPGLRSVEPSLSEKEDTSEDRKVQDLLQLGVHLDPTNPQVKRYQDRLNESKDAKTNEPGQGATRKEPTDTPQDSKHDGKTNQPKQDGKAQEQRQDDKSSESKEDKTEDTKPEDKTKDSKRDNKTIKSEDGKPKDPKQEPKHKDPKRDAKGKKSKQKEEVAKPAHDGHAKTHMGEKEPKTAPRDKDSDKEKGSSDQKNKKQASTDGKETDPKSRESPESRPEKDGENKNSESAEDKEDKSPKDKPTSTSDKDGETKAADKVTPTATSEKDRPATAHDKQKPSDEREEHFRLVQKALDAERRERLELLKTYNMRRNTEPANDVDSSLKIYRQCTHERDFIKKSCCFRDMCEVGNLNEKDTTYFKQLYGATVYDVHFNEFQNLKAGGKVILWVGTLSLFFLSVVILLLLSKMGAISHPRIREAALNLGILSWVASIFFSLLAFLVWNYYTGGSVCVDELGRSKPCSLHHGSIMFIMHIIFSGIGLMVTIVDSVLTRSSDFVSCGIV